MNNKEILDVKSFCQYSIRPRMWIENIKNFFRIKKFAKQRAKKGYCDYDLWDMDRYLLRMIHDMIEEYRNKADGYPGEFDSDNGLEKWQEILSEMAKEFDLSIIDEENDNQSNKYYKDFIEMLEEKRVIDKEKRVINFGEFDEEENELSKNYYEESKRIYEEHCEHRKKAFAMLSKWLPQMWY